MKKERRLTVELVARILFGQVNSDTTSQFTTLLRIRICSVSERSIDSQSSLQERGVI